MQVVPVTPAREGSRRPPTSGVQRPSLSAGGPSQTQRGRCNRLLGRVRHPLLLRRYRGPDRRTSFKHPHPPPSPRPGLPRGQQGVVPETTPTTGLGSEVPGFEVHLHGSNRHTNGNPWCHPALSPRGPYRPRCDREGGCRVPDQGRDGTGLGGQGRERWVEETGVTEETGVEMSDRDRETAGANTDDEGRQ